MSPDCPACGAGLDVRPVPGGYVVCGQCFVMFRFGPDRQPQQATADEMLTGCTVRQLETLKGQREAYLVLREFGAPRPRPGRWRRLFKRTKEKTQ